MDIKFLVVSGRSDALVIDRRNRNTLKISVSVGEGRKAEEEGGEAEEEEGVVFFTRSLAFCGGVLACRHGQEMI